MTSLQKKLLDMLAWFDKFCKQNNIVYFAAGGTVLGAARHGGFIPWDDDIDVVVPRPDYDRLLKIFNGKIDNYILESPHSLNKDYLYSAAKLYDTNTTLIEKTQHPCKRGIYIDVFPLDGIGNTEEESLSNYRVFEKQNRILLTRTCAIRKDRAWYKNAAIRLMKCVPSFVINEKKLVVKLDKIAGYLCSYDSKYVANLMGSYGRKEIVPRELFGDPKVMAFEDIEINVPQYHEEYLAHIYGDWKKLPPENKRKTTHEHIELNLEKSYLDE